MKSVRIDIDANAHHRYCVSEIDGQQGLYIGNDFEKVVEAIQMVNADATMGAIEHPTGEAQ